MENSIITNDELVALVDELGASGESAVDNDSGLDLRVSRQF